MTVSLTKDEYQIIKCWIRTEYEDGCFAVEGTEDDDDFFAENREIIGGLEEKLKKADIKESLKKSTCRLNRISFFEN
jgi:hypothetical protein